MGIRRRKIDEKRKNMVALLMLMVILAVLALLFSVRNASLCAHIQKGDYKEYTGEFSVDTRTRARNTIYIVTLGNGDVIQVNPDLIEQNMAFKSASVLRFSYSSPRYFFSSAYQCVDISDVSSDTVYLQSTTSYAEAKSCACIGGVITGVFLLFSILVALELSQRK